MFADPESQLVAARQNEQYDRHENDPGDWRYRSFLNRLALPPLERLNPGMQGLDFGCGPGPTHPLMLDEAGMTMAVFGPFYRPNADVLNW